MPNTAKESILYNYLRGWGVVDGHLVYLPLYDPPKARLNQGFRNLIVANVLREASKLLSTPNLAKKTNAIAREYASNVSHGLIAGWEDGDPICPPNWPFRHPHHLDGDSGAEQILEATSIFATITNEMPNMVKAEIIGFTMQKIGELIGDKSVIALGTEIVHSNTAMEIQ